MSAETNTQWTSPTEVAVALADVGYLADRSTAQVVFLGGALEKPILAEGPAGVGKTSLALAIADSLDRRLIRLQCYEGLDEARALYEWDYHKQLLRLQSDEGAAWSELEDDIFSEPFLLTRPLLEAIRAEEPVVLLIDEVDRVEVETEALLLEILDSYQVTIPELGTMTARTTPIVVLTSNNTRELSEALKRRCLYLHMPYPSIERERSILAARLPDLGAVMAEKIAATVGAIRSLPLRKAPSVSESIDWARTLVALGIEEVDDVALADTLGVLLKYQADIERVNKELSLAQPPDE